MSDEQRKKEIDEVTGVETTGHEWDGLKELNNPAPLVVVGVLHLYHLVYRVLGCLSVMADLERQYSRKIRLE